MPVVELRSVWSFLWVPATLFNKTGVPSYSEFGVASGGLVRDSPKVGGAQKDLEPCQTSGQD